MAQKITAEERRWRAESDADTMARYEEIMGDSSRKRQAISVAKQRASELNKRAEAMQRVANTGKPKKK